MYVTRLGYYYGNASSTRPPYVHCTHYMHVFQPPLIHTKTCTTVYACAVCVCVSSWISSAYHKHPVVIKHQWKSLGRPIRIWKLRGFLFNNQSMHIRTTALVSMPCFTDTKYNNSQDQHTCMCTIQQPRPWQCKCILLILWEPVEIEVTMDHRYII